MPSKINLEFNTETITESQWTKTGIYKITNLKNKKFYIGSVRGTSTFRNRFVRHQREFYHWINDNKHAPTPILDKTYRLI